jgi:ribonuclease BN (tRNA processing enzyme)
VGKKSLKNTFKTPKSCAMQRIYQLGIPFGDITGTFLTHHHSDHVVGFPDLWLIAYESTGIETRSTNGLDPLPR